MKNSGFVIAIGSTNGAPLFYTNTNLYRIFRSISVVAGFVVAIFSAGFFIGKIMKLRLFH